MKMLAIGIIIGLVFGVVATVLACLAFELIPCEKQTAVVVWLRGLRKLNKKRIVVGLCRKTPLDNTDEETLESSLRLLECSIGREVMRNISLFMTIDPYTEKKRYEVDFTVIQHNNDPNFEWVEVSKDGT